MSYVNKLEYRIAPTKAFQILRGCGGCGCKQNFTSTGRFRVNANGNHLDVWLIYSCEKCGHTYNLPIYERIKPDKIPSDEYQKFLENDEEAAFRYGTDKSFFARNRAEIDWNAISYELIPQSESPINLTELPIQIELYNPCELPLRAEKIAADILQISRSKVAKMIRDGFLSVNNRKCVV